MQQIGTANDPDHGSIADNRHPFDIVVFEKLGDFREGGVLAHGDDLAGHDFARVASVRLHVIGRELCVGGEEFQPPGAMLFSSSLYATDQIAFADDADQAAALVNDWNGADFPPNELSRHVAYSRLRPHADYMRYHYFGRFHSCSSRTSR